MSSDYPERERYYPDYYPENKFPLPGNYPDSILRHPSGRGFATSPAAPLSYPVFVAIAGE